MLKDAKKEGKGKEAVEGFERVESRNKGLVFITITISVFSFDKNKRILHKQKSNIPHIIIINFEVIKNKIKNICKDQN